MKPCTSILITLKENWNYPQELVITQTLPHHVSSKRQRDNPKHLNHNWSQSNLIFRHSHHTYSPQLPFKPSWPGCHMEPENLAVRITLVINPFLGSQKVLWDTCKLSLPAYYYLGPYSILHILQIIVAFCFPKQF